MRRILVLATLVAFIAVPQSFAGIGWIKSIAVAQQEAKSKKQMIFVDLFAEWCGWCHRFEADVYPSEAFQNATDDMTLLRLDTEDGGEGTKFAQRFQVTNLPTFLILNSDLSLVGMIRGYAPANEFAKIINKTLNDYKEFQKMVASESAYAKDYDKRLKIAQQFRERMDFTRSEPRFKKLTVEKSVPVAVRDQAYYELGLVYLLQGKYDDVTKTLNAFDKVQSQGDTYERAQLLALDVCLQRGNLRCAVDELRDFKQRFPKSPLNANVDMMLPSLERQLGPVKQ